MSELHNQEVVHVSVIVCVVPLYSFSPSHCFSHFHFIELYVQNNSTVLPKQLHIINVDNNELGYLNMSLQQT